MADALPKINHWDETVTPSILEQYKGATRWQACLKAIIEKLQYIDDATCELPSVLDFEEEAPTGKQLDWLVSLVNMTRLNGETDEELFTRFIVNLDKNDAGTPDAVIREAKFLSRTSDMEDVHFMNESPATFFVYTPKGRQLKRCTVLQISPACVLGLPGAALVTAKGSFIVGASSAQATLTDDSGNALTDGEGTILTIPASGSRRILCVASDNNIIQD